MGQDNTETQAVHDHQSAMERAARRIAEAEKLLITCHRGPDGDAVGSMISLATVLRTHGKQVVLYNPDPIPRRLRWLPVSRRFARELPKGRTFDATIVVDSAEIRLLGDSFPGPDVTGDVIVFDHHSTAVPYGDIYVCDPDAASSGVVIARLFRILGWELTGDAALGLYVSVVSDTGCFRYANTNTEALQLAAELVQRGVDPWFVSEHIYERYSIARYKLLALMIERIEFDVDGKLAYFMLTRELLSQAGATWEDSFDLVSHARGLDGVECGILLSPAKYGGIRVSMRSKSRTIDAGVICGAMGGGGHRGAAGCVLQGDMASVRAKVTQAVREVLAGGTAGDTGGDTG